MFELKVSRSGKVEKFLTLRMVVGGKRDCNLSLKLGQFSISFGALYSAFGGYFVHMNATFLFFFRVSRSD